MTVKESNRFIEERIAHSRKLSKEMGRSGDEAVKSLRKAASSVRAAKRDGRIIASRPK